MAASIYSNLASPSLPLISQTPKPEILFSRRTICFPRNNRSKFLFASMSIKSPRKSPKPSLLDLKKSSSMLIFVKYHGLGNDFILVDDRDWLEPRVMPEQVVNLCDRNFGIGADEVIFVMPGVNGTDYTMMILNSDGSEPEMCGNGVRCFARFIAELENIHGTRSFTFHTGAGLIVLEIQRDLKIKVDMGQPVLSELDVPTKLPANNNGAAIQAELVVDGLPWIVTCVSMGNRLCVTVGSKHSEVELVKCLIECPFADLVLFRKFARKFQRFIPADMEDPATEFESFSNSFHGRTMGALALTSKEHYRTPFEPVMPGDRVSFTNSGTEANEADIKFARKFQGYIPADMKEPTTEFVSFSNSFHGAPLILDEVREDVDGVLTCDPNICPSPTPEPCLTFDEALKLGYSAARVVKRGVKDKSKLMMVMVLDPKRVLEMQGAAKLEKAAKSVKDITAKMDSLALQVSNMGATVSKGKMVADNDIWNLIEQLMTQLIKLYGIVADGDLKLQRGMQALQVDGLKLEEIGTKVEHHETFPSRTRTNTGREGVKKGEALSILLVELKNISNWLNSLGEIMHGMEGQHIRMTQCTKNLECKVDRLLEALYGCHNFHNQRKLSGVKEDEDSHMILVKTDLKVLGERTHRMEDDVICIKSLQYNDSMLLKVILFVLVLILILMFWSIF